MSFAPGRRRTTRSGGRSSTRRNTGGRRGQRTLSRASSGSVELMENDEPEVLVMREVGPGEDRVCIDLTEDTDDSIVDLTNVDTPITLRRGPVSPRRSPRGAPILSPRRRPADVQIEDDGSDDDLPDLLPFVCESTSPKRPRGESSGHTANNLASPPAKFTCPVCLDDDKQIRRAGKRLCSTICGHLFCDECIEGAIRTQKRCPTCRKQLSLRSVHPIYL